MSRPLSLSVQPGRLAVARLPPGAPAPDWARGAPLASVTCTPEETSVIAPESAIPEGVRCEPGWRALEVAGPLGFELTGVLASIAVPLAEAGVSIFAVSTYDTDYVLVHEDRLGDAVAALRRNGHRVRM